MLLPSQMHTTKAAAAQAIMRFSKVAAEAEPAPQGAPVVPGKSMIDTLNKLLTSEFEAIHEYGGHYAVALNLGLNKLAAETLERINDERKHADALMYRIVFLGGIPIVDQKPTAETASTVPRQFELDVAKEQDAVKAYNAAVAEAVEAKDNVTRQLLEANLKDEDDHVDEISTEQGKIKLMGLQQYLATKV